MPTPRTLPEVWTFINSQVGPRDHFRTLEDLTAFKGLSFKPENLWSHQIPEHMIREWLCGADIKFNENKDIPLFDVNNYSSVSLHEELAAAELNRIIKDNKAILYPINIKDDVPFTIPGLSRSPGHMVFRKERLRWVTGLYFFSYLLYSRFLVIYITHQYLIHLFIPSSSFPDWSNRDVQLNQLCQDVDTNYCMILDLIHQIRPKSLIFGLDLVDCFSHWILRPHQRRLLGFTHPLIPSSGCFVFLPQGFAPSPGINDRNVKNLIDFTISRFPEVRLWDFVDDIRGIIAGSAGLSLELVSQIMDSIFKLWSDLGVRLHGPPKWDKYIRPTMVADWIGYTINTLTMYLSIKKDKCEEIHQALSAFVRKIEQEEDIHALELASVLGTLRWAILIVFTGNHYVKCANDALTASGANRLWSIKPKPRHQANPKISNPKSFLKDMIWWRDIFKTVPQLKIHHRNNQSFLHTPDDIEFAATINPKNIQDIFLIATADASKEGWGVSINQKQFRGTFSKDFNPPVDGKKTTCNIEETTTVVLWQQHLIDNNITEFNDKLILWNSDNTCAKTYINHGKCKNIISEKDPEKLRLDDTGRQHKSYCQQLGQRIIAEHIEGPINVVSDSISRFQTQFIPQDPFAEKFLEQSHWMSLMGRLSPTPTFEIFADREGVNCRLSHMYHVKHDVFLDKEDSWKNHVSWWFPPRHLVYNTLKKLLHVMRLKKHERPICYILVEKDASKFDYFINKFNIVFTFRSGLFLFSNIEKSGTISRLPKTDTKYVVLSSVGAK